MTVTREDREAAEIWWCGSFEVARAELVGDYPDDCALGKLVHAFAAHRLASTQALREAAERLCDHLDVEGADQWVSGWEAEACRLRVALRSALAGSPAGGEHHRGDER